MKTNNNKGLALAKKQRRNEIPRTTIVELKNKVIKVSKPLIRGLQQSEDKRNLPDGAVAIRPI